MANPSVTWLTQETYDRLKAELDELAVNGREEIAKRIEEAREDGDLKENAGYHAAKDEQGKIEARINQLETMLKNSEVREAPEASGIVETGTVREIFDTPREAYTRRLLAAGLDPDPEVQKARRLTLA